MYFFAFPSKANLDSIRYYLVRNEFLSCVSWPTLRLQTLPSPYSWLLMFLRSPIRMWESSKFQTRPISFQIDFLSESSNRNVAISDSDSKWNAPSEQIPPKLPKRRITSEISQPKYPKRKFPNEGFKTNGSKRRIPSESYAAHVHIHSISQPRSRRPPARKPASKQASRIIRSFSCLPRLLNF